MSAHTVMLDDAHFRAAQNKAQELGTTPDEYIQRLIDSDCLSDESFDQILAPIRKGFEHVGDEELERLFADARRRAGTDGQE